MRTIKRNGESELKQKLPTLASRDNGITMDAVVVVNILSKTLIAAKPLCIRVSKIDGFTRVYNGTRYLVLCGPEKYDAIFNRIKYLYVKKVALQVMFHNFAKIKVDSYDSLPLEEMLNLYVIIHTLSQFLIKIKITTTIIYSLEKVPINYLKDRGIKFFDSNVEIW